MFPPIKHLRIFLEPHEFALTFGCTLRATNVRRIPDGWLLTLKITKRANRNLVGYFEAGSPMECLELAYRTLVRKDSYAYFYPDRY